MRRGWATLAALLVSGTAAARPEPDPLEEGAGCRAAIAREEAAHGIPHGLLEAIGYTEAGRATRQGRTVWPWTINAQGQGRFLDDKPAALRATRELLAQGITSIDVGCLQVNLRQHPDAFASLDEAFDPAANVAYAAAFLTRLHDESGDWLSAARHYHSATPELAAAYGEKVVASWRRTGGPSPAAPAMPPPPVAPRAPSDVAAPRPTPTPFAWLTGPVTRPAPAGGAAPPATAWPAGDRPAGLAAGRVGLTLADYRRR